MTQARALHCAAVAAALLAASCGKPVTQQASIDVEALEREERLQLEAAYEYLLGHEHRLWNIGITLRKSATHFCPEDVANGIDAIVRDLSVVPEEFREVAAEVRGIGELPVVEAVHPGGAAERAGLSAGDAIVRLDVISFEGEGATTLSALSRERLQRETADGTVEAVVERDGTQLTLTVGAVPMCDYPVVLANDDRLNAFADGNAVFVTRGLMNFADDRELAFVVSHELAHNAMGHVDAKAANTIGGLVLDAAIMVATYGAWQGGFGAAGSLIYSHEFEAEADYVGLYVMARAGMEIGGAAEFWRKMAAETGTLSKSSPTHPSNAERFLAMSGTIEEINGKIGSGEPLEPNLREGAAAPDG